MRRIYIYIVPHENHMEGGQPWSFFSDFLGNDECQLPRI